MPVNRSRHRHRHRHRCLLYRSILVAVMIVRSAFPVRSIPSSTTATLDATATRETGTTIRNGIERERDLERDLERERDPPPRTVPTKRIVGGRDAPPRRYPYFVALLDSYNGTHKCAGSLVAPDVVLTAAHCDQDLVKYARVGVYYTDNNHANDHDNNHDNNDGSAVVDVREVVGWHPHPFFATGTSFSYDAILVVLDRKSTLRHVRINTDPGVPGGISGSSSSGSNSGNDVGDDAHNFTVLGIGSTRFTKFGSSSVPDVLQETTLSFVPNRVCRRSKDPSVEDSYQDLISDDMLCAFENDRDACQGDSGGPLIRKGSSASSDVLVGIVSWGFGCAHPSFPGVYSRVSYYSDWIIATICRISSDPPVEYDCANVTAPSDEQRSVPVTVVIRYDDHPGEISWAVVGLADSDSDTESNQEGVLVSVAEDTEASARSRVQKTIFLPPGTNVTFTIRDRYGDGLCCNTPGSYRVVLGRDPVGTVLASGEGDFGSERSHTVRVPLEYAEEATERPPVVADGEILLTVAIQLDGFPEEVGWRIERLGSEVEVVVRIPTGIYTTPETTVVRTVVLEKNELYCFHVYDVAGDGIGDGYVKLYLGTTGASNDSDQVIFESDGNIRSGIDHTFFAGFPPNNLLLLPPSDVFVFLTLVMKMDLFPGEISVQLRMNRNEPSSMNRDDDDDDDDDPSDSVVFFRPPHYYHDRVNEVVTERIPIPRTPVGGVHRFSFIISDRSGDGMCCAWSIGGLDETGYTLYKGDPSSETVIAHSRFESVGREVQRFSIRGDTDDSVADEIGPDVTEEGNERSIRIRVAIQLGLYPEETGFTIADSSGATIVVYVPPGTFVEQTNALVERSFDLRHGLYTFSLVDTAFGDGTMNPDGIAYRIDFADDDHRPSILTGASGFEGSKRQVFLLERDDEANAQWWLQMDLKTGLKPEEFGFSMYRLDRIESVASVASRSKGEYDTAFDAITERWMVTRGALYRILFENSYSGVSGEIRMTLASSDHPDTVKTKTIEYTFDTASTQDSRFWQVTLYADEPLSAPPLGNTNSSKILNLRMPPDRLFPPDIEWILVSTNDNGNNDKASRPSSLVNTRERGRGVIAYGPLQGRNWSRGDTIPIPRPNGTRSYALIVTGTGINHDHDAAWLGEGSSLRLYEYDNDEDEDDGEEDEEESLVPFDDTLHAGGRVVVFFSLVDSGAVGGWSSMIRRECMVLLATSLLLGLTLLL